MKGEKGCVKLSTFIFGMGALPLLFHPRSVFRDGCIIVTAMKQAYLTFVTPY
jgi:hypothetical protein